MFMKKEREKMEKYGSYIKKLQDEAEIAEKKLQEFDNKMQRCIFI